MLDNVKLPILNRNYSYRPDFCLYWAKKQLYIDIEIDEPYDIVSRKPIHYQGNGDNLRDRYFIRNGLPALYIFVSLRKTIKNKHLIKRKLHALEVSYIIAFQGV